MSDCLTDEQIEQYVAGSATAEQRETCEAHARNCPDCATRIEHRRAGEELLGELRQLWQTEALSHVPSDEDADFVPGYGILEELHRGGQGVVYKAVQRSTERVVAVKLLHAGPAASEPARKRFEREIKLAARLQHPHIVAIHDSGIADGCPYVVMDYVSGPRITEYATSRGLSIADRLQLFATTCGAVEYAHQAGVIHRDLKPSNILVNQQGEPVIVDFGLAREIQPRESAGSDGVVTAPGQVLGSLPYLSPEQAAGDPSQIDERTDVYALGVLLYELLTGTCPPPVPIASPSPGVSPPSPSARPLPPSQACVGLDARLDPIVLKALAHEKTKRYRSAGDLAAMVHGYLAQPHTSSLSARPAWTRRLTIGALVLWSLVATSATLLIVFGRAPDHLSDAAKIESIAMNFNGSWPGGPPAKWVYFGGALLPEFEGKSNLYVTNSWATEEGKSSLRSETRIGKYLRFDALDVSKIVESTDRLYYECWLHLSGKPLDCGVVGFIGIDPWERADGNWQFPFANAVRFYLDGEVVWQGDPWSVLLLSEWPQGQEFVCHIRVWIDFANNRPTVFLDYKDAEGKDVRIRKYDDLPICPKRFASGRFENEPLVLDRWGFGPGCNPTGRDGKPLGDLDGPIYVDIDELTVGPWEAAPPLP